MTRAVTKSPMMASRRGFVTVTMVYALPIMLTTAVMLFKLSSLVLAVAYMSPYVERLARVHGPTDDVAALVAEFNASPMTFWCQGDGIAVIKRQAALSSGVVYEVIDTTCAYSLMPSWTDVPAIIDLRSSQLWRRVSP